MPPDRRTDTLPLSSHSSLLLVSQSCSKCHRPGSLEQQRFFSYCSGGWKSKTKVALLPSGGSRGQSFRVSLLAPSGCQQCMAFLSLEIHHSNLSLYIVFSPMCLSVSPRGLLTRTQVIGLGPSLISYGLILTNYSISK